MTHSHVSQAARSFIGAALIVITSVSASAQTRRKVGVAFGGGSAKGIAHVGVIRWFEEHRIPIDVEAGTSMGGLVGGCFATGMSAAELANLLSTLNWDELFGASTFAYKNVRRKADARAYPSRLEFGLKHGVNPPVSLNTGQQVDLFLQRIAAPYYAIATFDDLPTPFRAVAMDLLTSSQVILDRGSLASAMRATMSLPLIFPPVELDGRVLVDGGTMNNVPADVARRMGADVVIAVNVGDLSTQAEVSRSMLGLLGNTLDAMMRASTRAGMASADVVLNVPLVEKGYGSLDWRRAPELVEEGYRAAEAMREQLLPYALGESDYEQWASQRRARRRTTVPTPRFLTLQGVAAADEDRMRVLMRKEIGRPLDIKALEADLTQLSGLDRYETVDWRLMSNETGEVGLVVQARAKATAPPFLMLGASLENTTTDTFGVSLSARYLSFDVPFSGAEIRLDGTIGSASGAGAEWYQPLGKSPLFIAPFAGVSASNYEIVRDEAVIARYDQTLMKAGASVGVNLGTFSDLRAGAYIGRVDATVAVGNPGLPSVSGKQTVGDVVWRYDGQDSTVVPSRGLRTVARLDHIFDDPAIVPPLPTGRSSVDLTQFETTGTSFHSIGPAGRVFVNWGFGTSFAHKPLPIDQFELGQPFRLGAYNLGELNGDHYYVATAGYLHALGRMPDFLGGPIYAGAWLENGDAFDDWHTATWRTQAGLGVVMDTLAGPVLFGGTAGFDGRWSWYIAIGRIFR
jgi:NTE family protein